MFGKKSRLERENDTLEERIGQLEFENEKLEYLFALTDRKWLRLLREYRYSQKANCKYKRANKRLREMLDTVGWPRNDIVPEKTVNKKRRLP